jgi:hypothetical protein
MKIKDFTIEFEAGEFKDNVLDIITFDIKRRTNRDLGIEKTDNQITVTIPGEVDFIQITDIIGMIKYWKNVQ